MTDRAVVLVSPYFPPSGVAGVHRARHLAKHLPAAGWKPIVLCVDESDYEQRLDPDLASLVPKNTEIVKVKALSARVTRPLGIGEISLRAWSSLRTALMELLKRPSVAGVLITGSPYYPMLFANAAKQRFHVPIVLDFQDPWVSAWGAMQPQFSKVGLAHRAATILEPRALRSADFITAVSDAQNQELAARYSWLDPNRMAAVPIGGDPDDFAMLRNRPSNDGAMLLEPGYVHLSYVGTIWPRVVGSIRMLLRAFARLRVNEPRLTERIRMNFIGTNADPNDSTTFRVRGIAEEEGVVEAVCEIPRRLPYLDALAVLTRSDGLLLIGSDEPHYTASKIYPALMSQRPYLSLFHSSSSAHKILLQAGGGRTLSFANDQELRSQEAPLADALRMLAAAPEAFGKANPEAYAPYEARNIAHRYADIFGMLAAEHAALRR